MNKEEVKECPRCETKTDSNQKFCRICGFKLSNPYDRKADGKMSRPKEVYEKAINKIFPISAFLMAFIIRVFYPTPFRHLPGFMQGTPFFIFVMFTGVIFFLWLFSGPKD
jgi:hypothetical protein